MSKENMDLLRSIESIEERLKFAEKLVFGLDGMDIDLSAGMNVIKTEAQNKNPQAEFLMYKVNLSRDKQATAIEWLKKSSAQKYGPALAAVFYEFLQGNMKKMSSDDAMSYLKEAVALDVPFAHLLMGYIYNEGLYTYNKNEKKATIHFDKAVKLGFGTHYFSTFNSRPRSKKLSDYLDGASPESFKEGLIEKIFDVPDLFYLACGTDKEKEFVLDVWKEYIDTNPQKLEIKKFSNALGKQYVFIQITSDKRLTDAETMFFLITFEKNGNGLKICYCNKSEIYAPDIMFIKEANVKNFDKQHLYYGPATIRVKEKYSLTPGKKITAFIKNAIHADNKGEIPVVKENITPESKDLDLYIMHKEAEIFAENAIYKNAYQRMMHPALIWDILNPLTQTIGNTFGIAFRDDVLNNILNIIKNEAHLNTTVLYNYHRFYKAIFNVNIKSKDILTFIALKAFIDLCEDISRGKINLYTTKKQKIIALFKAKLRHRLSIEKKDDIKRQLLRSAPTPLSKEDFERLPLHKIKHPISDKDMKGTPIRTKPLDNK